MRSGRFTRFFVAVAAVGVLAGMWTGCSRDPNVRKQKYFESGQRYFDKRQYREAAIQFQNAIQVDSKFAQAHYKLGLTAVKLEQWPLAYQEFSTAIQLQPNDDPSRLELTKLLILGHQFSEAKTQLDLLQQKGPDNAEEWVVRSNYDMGMNDTDAALKDLEKARGYDPRRPDIYLNLAAIETRLQHFDKAEADLKQAVEYEPNSARALMAQGTFYRVRGRFPEAEQAFERAITVAPADPDPRLALAALYVAENKPGQAEDFLRRATQDFPNNSIGYRMLGDYYYASNQLDKATEEYGALYKEHPKDGDVKKNYIQLLILRDHIEEARKLDDEILKLTPDDEDGLIYRGEIEMKSGKMNDAVNTLQGVIKSDPDSALAHLKLGIALAELGNSNRAEAEWRDVVRLRPQIVEAHRALAGVAIQKGDAAGLAQEADQIIALQSSAPDGYVLRAIADMERKDLGSADKNLHEALARDPSDSAAYIQLGNLRMAQKQLADAQKAYQQALDRDPNSTDALGGVMNVALVEKDPDRALAAARAQIAKSPNNASFHVMAAELLMDHKNDLAGAQQEFERALALDKNNTEAMLKMGLLENSRGEVDKALETYLDGEKAHPNASAFYLFAGGIYEKRRDWERARQQYQKVLDMDPENALASNNLAYVMLEQGGNIEVAFSLAQTARRELPDNPSAADTLGWAFYQRQIYDSAISLFKEAVRKDPGNTTFNKHLGLAYVKSRQYALAQQQLDRIVRIDPKSPDAAELRQALAVARG
jgi:cellulose synthase operon protein C